MLQVRLRDNVLRSPPELGTRGATDYLLGLATVAQRMVVLLDIDRLIGRELTAISGSADESNEQAPDGTNEGSTAADAA